MDGTPPLHYWIVGLGKEESPNLSVPPRNNSQILQIFQSRRSIDLSQEKRLISEMKLPTDIVPNSYKLELYPSLQDNTFHGRVIINASCVRTTSEINLHSQTDMQIDTQDILVRKVNEEQYVTVCLYLPPRAS